MRTPLLGQHRMSGEEPPAERIAVIGGRPVVGSSDGSLRFGARRRTAHTGPLVTLEVHEGLLLSAGRDGYAALWDADGEPLFVCRHPVGPIRAAAFVSSTVVMADDHGFVFAVDLHTGERDWVGELNMPITAICGDGAEVMVGTEQGTVHGDRWVQKRHRGPVLGLYAGPFEGLISVGEDGRVRRGRELLVRVRAGVVACAFSGRRLLLALEREVQDWDLPSLSLVRSAESVAGPVQDVALDERGAWILVEGESEPRRWS